MLKYKYHNLSLECMTEDMEYLQEELGHISPRLERLRKLVKPQSEHSNRLAVAEIYHQVKEQMELAQNQRTMILTFLAALYIPLSFVAVISPPLSRHLLAKLTLDSPSSA